MYRKNSDGINDRSLGTLFFIKRSSNVDDVDLAILLKKDSIIRRVIKFIITTIIDINNIITPDDIRFDRYGLIP